MNTSGQMLILIVLSFVLVSCHNMKHSDVSKMEKAVRDHVVTVLQADG